MEYLVEHQDFVLRVGATDPGTATRRRRLIAKVTKRLQLFEGFGIEPRGALRHAHVRVASFEHLEGLAERGGNAGLARREIVLFFRVLCEVIEFRPRRANVLKPGCDDGAQFVPAEGVSRIVRLAVNRRRGMPDLARIHPGE